jgi:hypothetical protein
MQGRVGLRRRWARRVTARSISANVDSNPQLVLQR